MGLLVSLASVDKSIYNNYPINPQKLIHKTIYMALSKKPLHL